jgi:hypothetical protein
MKVGDYVRYRCAYDNTIKIKKINAIVPPDNLIKENYYKFDDYEGTIEKCIIKSSPNIIDLIEVGDYVNGNRVIEIDNKSKDIFNKYLLVEETDYDNCNISYSNNDIKSIVTKEQFESMEYKVKE